MKDETRGWLKKADEDLDAAKYNYAGEKHAVSIFLCQQAAEKALKALFLERKDELIKTHDLVLLSKNLNAPKEITDHAKDLTMAYTYTRYPDVPEIKGIKYKNKIFLDYVGGVILWVKKQLS